MHASPVAVRCTPLERVAQQGRLSRERLCVLAPSLTHLNRAAASNPAALQCYNSVIPGYLGAKQW